MISDTQHLYNNLTFLTSKMITDIRSATITEKGQISIPKSLRKNKFFKEGSKIAILTFKDHVELRPLSEISKNMETALASEKVLAKEWNTKEEDKAWKDL